MSKRQHESHHRQSLETHHRRDVQTARRCEAVSEREERIGLLAGREVGRGKTGKANCGVVEIERGRPEGTPLQNHKTRSQDAGQKCRQGCRRYQVKNTTPRARSGSSTTRAGSIQPPHRGCPSGGVTSAAKVARCDAGMKRESPRTRRGYYQRASDPPCHGRREGRCKQFLRNRLRG